MLLAAAGLLLIAVVALLTLLYLQPQRLIDLSVSAVHRFTPYELALTEPSLSWSPLSFRSDLFLLKYADESQPPLVSVQGPDLSMSLLELLTGNITKGYFRARNVTYYLSEQESSEPLNLEALLSPLGRLPQTLEVESLHLISGGSDLWVFPLHRLSAQRNQQGSMEATAELDLASRPLMLQARADWQSTDSGGHQLELQAGLYGRDDRSELLLSGRVDAAGSDLSYSLAVEGRYADIGDFLKALEQNAYPLSGSLELAGQLTGDTKGYRLELSRLSLERPDAFAFSASGRISRQESEPVRLDLQARGNAQQLDALQILPPALLGAMERSEVQLSIGGTLEEPELVRAALVLLAAGDTRIEFNSAEQSLDLQALRDLSPEQSMRVAFSASIGEVDKLWQAAGGDPLPLPSASAELSGVLESRDGSLWASLESLTVREPGYRLTGEARILWRDALLSAPSLQLRLVEQEGPGAVSARGAVADLLRFQGLGLQVQVNDLSAARALKRLDLDSDLPLGTLGGDVLVQRAVEGFRLRDMALDLQPTDGISVGISGNAGLAGGEWEADLALSLKESSSAAWAELLPFAEHPRQLDGQLRLRPSYLTFISDLSMGSTQLQSVLSANISERSISSLAADLYAPSILLEDFALRAPSDEGDSTGSAAASTNPDPAATPLATLREQLPTFPVHLTLRSNAVSGSLSRLSALSLALDLDEGRILLRELDTRYAGGELILRGVIDTTAQPPAISLAGRGIRVPLAAITEDLNIQQSVSGSVSLRGGLSTRGDTLSQWQSQLQGRVATALADVNVSGAAYDLLMSNLLAWLVRGAGEKSTTFDCSMAQFDISAGVARSENLYVETSRMLATGKATIDLPANRLDLRIEPRSKSRTLQFPSAVRARGPLNDPQISVSPLQTTADLSAQALLLLPSLTLNLFGLGSNDEPLRPCRADAG